MKELPKDSVSESLDEWVEDTDISDMTNPISAENIDSLEFIDDQNTEQDVINAVNDVKSIAKEIREYNQEATEHDVENQGACAVNVKDNT